LNFAFFHGNLKYNLYLLSTSLFTWFLKNLWYYFTKFLEENSTAVRDALIVTYNEETSITISEKFSDIDICQLNFKLNPKFIEKHKLNPKNPETNSILLDLEKSFIALGIVTASIYGYTHKTKHLSKIIITFRLICWYHLFLYITSYNIITPIVLQTPSIFGRFISLSLTKRSYATEAFFLQKTFQKNMEKISSNTYKSGHPVTTDTAKADGQDNIPFYHQPTHGNGDPSNPSKPLHSTQDLQGQPRPQNAVYPPTKVSFPKKWIGTKILNSQKFYQDPEVVANDTQKDKNYTPDEKS